MARVKVNQFPSTASIADTDLGVTANPTSGVSSKITWLNIVAYLRSFFTYKSEINATTTELGNAALNAAYPDAKPGDEVICKDITDNPLIYKKITSTTWGSLPYGSVGA